MTTLLSAISFQVFTMCCRGVLRRLSRGSRPDRATCAQLAMDRTSPAPSSPAGTGTKSAAGEIEPHRGIEVVATAVVWKGKG
ncbi:hypothetical protein BCR34DRAFT_73662 [Clohesyomyces aquaticus]|uniref:Uncharacterized protein n=1 Tax=Clohesyomyces aquaticus TaxID=1231657 RepID=A0A1Y2A3K2_9PLEO|nr:hypothetical protein BCR34DRAFT_73662 [Clohesyomyces aquaticus]